MRPDQGSWLFSVPSKTYLMGEYAVLQGRPATVLTHGPRFRLRVSQVAGGGCAGIHPLSPAGRWIRKNAKVFADLSLEFLDPHEGRGGFGASSAQFVLVHTAGKTAEKFFAGAVNPKEIWDDFRSLHEDEIVLPSGGDVVAQTLGGVVNFQIDPWQIKAATWPFPDLTVLVVPTGMKIATHEHLRERLPLSERLLNLAEQGANAFQSGDGAAFLKLILQYAEELESLRLVADSTRELIAQLSASPEVLAVKGCGAMGADVLAVFVHKKDASLIKQKLNDEGLSVLATSSEPQSGLRLEIELAPRLENGDPLWV